MDDPIGSHAHNVFRHVVVATLLGVGETPILFAVEIGEDPILVGETSVGAEIVKRSSYGWLARRIFILIFLECCIYFLMGVLVNKYSRGRWGKRFKSTREEWGREGAFDMSYTIIIEMRSKNITLRHFSENGIIIPRRRIIHLTDIV